MRAHIPDTDTALDPSMLFSVAYTRLLAHELALEEKDWDRLLEGTRLAPDALANNERFISLNDQQKIIRNALAMSDAPGLGLRLGSKLHLIAHGPVGIAATSAPSVAAGFDVLVRFQGIRAQFATVQLCQSGDGLAMRLVPHVALDPVGLFLIEAVTASFRCSVDFILGQVPCQSRFAFAYPEPEHADLYCELLRGECQFNQPHTEIVLPAELLQRRSLFADDELHRQALLQCQTIEQDLKRNQRLSDQIRKRIRQNQYNCSLDDMAAQFNVCPRTLIRKLKQEETSFSQIMEQELQSAALQHLRDTSLSVENISALLGYQNVVNFRRAFQRWFGQPPGEYRQRIR